jgi:hypothetical protein
MVLISFLLFQYQNLINLEGGHGYKFLFAMAVLAFALFILDKGIGLLFGMRKSVFFAFLFLFYVTVNYVINGSTLSELKAVTIGTTGGMVFAIIIGCTLAYSIDTIYRVSTTSKMYSKLSGFYTLTTLVLSTVLLYFVLGIHLVSVRSDIFLIEGMLGLYQRPGTFLTMQMIMLTWLALSALASGSISTTVSVVFTLGILTLASFFMVSISQIVGSNSGAVSVVALYLALLLCMFIQKHRLISNKYKIRNSLTELIVLICKRSILFFTLLFSVLVLLFIAVDQLDLLDTSSLDRFRIFGFGNGMNSFDSRFTSIRENYIVQLSYAPIVGNTAVDSLTTGTGTYAHSIILSILTHQGVCGLVLFFLFIISVYDDIAKSAREPHSRSIYQGTEMSVIRIILFTLIFVIAIGSTFYTWAPFWFSAGLLGIQFSRAANLNKPIRVHAHE